MIASLLGFISKPMLLLAFFSVVFAVPSDDETLQVKTLKAMSSFISESQRPCHNFNDFACGNWETPSNLFAVMKKRYEKVIKIFLNTDEPVNTELEENVKDFFLSCQNKKYRNLQELILEFGNMPGTVEDSWQEETFDWQTTSALMQYRYGIISILGFEVMPDLTDISKHSIFIGNQYVKRKSTESAKVASEVSSIMQEMSSWVGINFRESRKTASFIFSMERSLAEGLPDDTEEVMFQLTTIEELQRKYSPTLNITHMLDKALGSIPNCAYYADHKYLENLVNVMSRTPKIWVANYVFYKLLQNFQSIKCFSDLQKIFPSVLENIFFRKSIKNETLDDLHNLWLDIKSSFKDFVVTQNWITSEAKQNALDKINLMKMHISGSKENEDLQNLLQNYKFSTESYIENMKTIRSLYAQYDRNKIDQAPDRTMDWQRKNIFSLTYRFSQNIVLIPVAYLQPSALFSTFLPNYFNYARMGALLSHEIVHAFDDIKLNDWWDKEIIDAFNNYVKCVLDPFEKLGYISGKLPKTLQQFENLADYIGVRVAYQAYVGWYNNSSRSAEELQLETFSNFIYNHKQLFFISYAQMYCVSWTHKPSASDRHTPTELRALTALSNIPEFAHEFACRIGSAMNPGKKFILY